MSTSDAAAGARADPRGLALVIGSALCYSFLAILGKVAYEERLSLASLLSTRFTIAAIVLWGLVFLSPRLRRARAALPRRRALGLFACGIGGFAGQSALYFSALKLISASLTEVLLYTCPAFVALILWGTTGRRPSPQRLLAIVLAVAGTYLCAGPIGEGTDIVGALVAVAAGLWYAVFLLVLGRLTSGVPGMLTSALVITGAGAAFDVAAVLGGGYRLPGTAAAWGAVLGMVLSATVVGFTLFIAGLARVGARSPRS